MAATSGPSESLNLTPTREEQYERMILNVQNSHGCSRSKARRILESIARKETKKFIKAGKKRQAALAAAGKLVTPEDLLGQEEADA